MTRLSCQKKWNHQISRISNYENRDPLLKRWGNWGLATQWIKGLDTGLQNKTENTICFWRVTTWILKRRIWGDLRKFSKSCRDSWAQGPPINAGVIIKKWKKSALHLKKFFSFSQKILLTQIQFLMAANLLQPSWGGSVSNVLLVQKRWLLVRNQSRNSRQPK